MGFPGGFTVLMALYDGDKPELFARAIHSVFSNTLLPDNFIVVVDGPINERLKSAVYKIQSQYPLIQFVFLPNNQGLAYALNIGLGLIKTAWVARADADDINLPDRFAIQANAIASNPQTQLLGGAILEVDQNSCPLAIREMPCSEGLIREFAKRRNPFNHMSVVYRADSVRACGGYPNVFLKEDYGLWCLLLARNAHVMNINDILVHASAGIEMFKRRGGLRYAKSEWAMQKLLVQCGLKGYLGAFFDGCIRVTFFLIPSSVRGFFYLRFLRKSI